MGTGLAAAGAAALNEILEIRQDTVMLRTRRRPLPAGDVSTLHALAFALATSFAGCGILNELVNPLTAFLGLANIVIYAAIYTPLKTRTSLSTLVGAVCGALPPLMGWTGAANSLGLGGVLLGLILFLWQIPHFLALVWMLRDDYARAGFRMLPLIDPQGHLTCLMIVLYSLALLPMGLVLMVAGVAGFPFAAASLVLGLGLLRLALELRRLKTPRNARRVFFASLVYLPLLMLALVIDVRVLGGRTGNRDDELAAAMAKPSASTSAAAPAVVPVGWDQRAQANAGRR